MTLTNSRAKNQYVGNGSAKSFPVTFKYLESSHVYVVLTDIASQVDTPQTVTTHYTISGDGTLGTGTVNFVTAPTASQRVTIYRSTPITQESSLVENGVLSGQTIESAIDKITMIMQELAEQAERASKIEVTDDGSVPAPLDSAGVTDVFVGQFSAAPTGKLHPFVEMEPDAAAVTWGTLSGGRSGNAWAINGCEDDLSGKRALIIASKDTDGNTAYHFQMPGDCA